MRTNDDNELVSQMLHSSDIHVVHATPFFLKKSIPGLATQTLGLCCRACLAGKIQTWLLLNETDPDQSSIWAMSPTMSCVYCLKRQIQVRGQWLSVELASARTQYRAQTHKHIPTKRDPRSCLLGQPRIWDFEWIPDLDCLLGKWYLGKKKKRCT